MKSSETTRRTLHLLERRTFMALVSGGLLAAPLAAEAQPATKVPRLGILTPAPCRPEDNPPWSFFLDGLRARGYVPGQSILLECRFSDKLDMQQFRQFASELVRLNVDLIFAISSTVTQAVRQVTSTFPVVAMDLETDPVATGLAASLARPGGNITGIFLDAGDLSGKWLELLRAVVPRLRRVTALWDATMDPTPLRATEAMARSLDIRFHVVAIRSPREIEGAFREAKKVRADAVILMQSPLTDVHGETVAVLAMKNRLPTIAMFPTFPSQGGLMSYGPDIRQLYTHVASLIDRILKGARPGQVPIERPTHFYFVVNGKTAKALGLTIPPLVLGRADEVIQ